MTLVKWTMENLETSDSYTFLINPNEMTSPFTPRQTEHRSRSPLSTSHRAWRKPFTPFEWTFSGVFYEKAQYEMFFQLWKTRAKFELTDHYGRTMVLRVVGFAPEQKAPMRRLHPFRQTYSMKCLVYSQASKFDLP